MIYESWALVRDQLIMNCERKREKDGKRGMGLGSGSKDSYKWWGMGDWGFWIR
jgi:hypothetical protein